MNIRRNQLIAGGCAIALTLWIALGFFGLHTLFIDDRVSEASPFSPLADPVIEPEVVNAKVDGESDTDQPVDIVTPTPVAQVALAEESGSDEVQGVTETSATPEVPRLSTLASGTVINHEHEGTGSAVVITDGVQTFLRFEADFAIDNGPDLNVYLVRGASASGDPGLFDDDFIDLGDLKGNIGAQNYLLPDGTNVIDFNTVAIWCVRFGVAFNAIDLQSP